MIIRVCAFTEKGTALLHRLQQNWQEATFQYREKEEPLRNWVEDSFAKRMPMLFVGACGIVVRSIAPFLQDKCWDSPVLILNESGEHVIPILSGHLGGANAYAKKIEEMIQAKAVLTTATDVNGVFSVDVFAANNGLQIWNREGIAKVSSRLLQGEHLSIAIDPLITYDDKEIPEELILQKNAFAKGEERQADICIYARDTWVNRSQELSKGQVLITLVTKDLILGMGCKKGKSFEEIKTFLEENCPFAIEQEIAALASIDLKKEEAGLCMIAQYYHMPFYTFTAEELLQTEGDYTPSDFVKEVTGVDNVCERAAVCGSGAGYLQLAVRKTAANGMTMAVAKRKPQITTWSTEENTRIQGKIAETLDIRVEQVKQKEIYIVGMGPGSSSQMTGQAYEALEQSDVIVGYTVYVELLKGTFPDKEFATTPMKQEIERCRMCFEYARQGKKVALVCSGDAGVYGMAAPMFELLPEYEQENIELMVVPGITAANSGAAVLGAPLNHDYCVISLSDLLTPWEKIEGRLKAAIEGDFAIAIYNPSSHKRRDYLKRACDIMLQAGASPDRACGYVENIGRENTTSKVCTLAELREEEVNMFTTVFIGNEMTKIMGDKLVTRRGYRI